MSRNTRTPASGVRNRRSSMSEWASPIGIVALVMLASLVFLAAAGPLIWGSAAARVNTSAVLQPPSSAHLLGSDNLGRDLFARLLAATRLSLLLAVVATLIGAAAGVGLGALTAVVGPRGRRWIGALINLVLAFPGLLVAIFFSVIFGGGARGAVLALAIGSIASFARITQTLAAGIAEADFVASARVLGVRRHRLLARHILPNIAEPLILNTTMACAANLIGLASLSFLGLGVQSPDYDWGLLLNQDLNRIFAEPLPVLAPGLAIVYASLMFQLLGEVWAGRMRDAQPAAHRRRRSDTTAAKSRAGSIGRDQKLVLDIEDLTVSFPRPGGVSRPVRGVSLAIREGEIVGIVGESGSGKSLTALTIADLAPETAQVTWSTNCFLGQNVAGLSRRGRIKLFATGMAMIFQNPASALNPSLRIGTQLTEAIRLHRQASRTEAAERAQASLVQVSLPTGRGMFRARAFQLSGGMRQRTMIAMGLMMHPKLIVADEPTTALDVTVQRQVVDLLTEIRDRTGAAIIFISHDIAVVSQLCDRLLVMYGGHIVEDLPMDQLVASAAHPYTRALLAAVPDMRTDRTRPLPTIDGAPPDPESQSAGCRFAPRCGARTSTCDSQLPNLTRIGVEHKAACWNPVPPNIGERHERPDN